MSLSGFWPRLGPQFSPDTKGQLAGASSWAVRGRGERREAGSSENQDLKRKMKDCGSDWLPGESHGDSVQCPVGARHPRGDAKANPRKIPPPPRAREAALFTWPQTGNNPNVPNRMTVVFFHKMEYSSAIFKNLLIRIKTRTNFKSILVREGSQTQERPAF